MGRIATTQSDDLGIVTMTANSTIAAGDLIINTDGGRATKATTDLDFSTNNSTTAGATTISTDSNFENSGVWATNSSYRYRSSCELSNGNIVHCFGGNNSSTGQWANFVIRNVGNGTVVSRVQVSSDASVEAIRVYSLTGQDKFVVIWAFGSTIAARIYNNDGTAVAAAFNVFTNNQGPQPVYWAASHLSDGGFVIISNGTPSPYPLRFRRYDSSGTLQGSETTVEASGNPLYISIAPLSSGGFVVGWYNNTNSRHSVTKYDSSGVIVGSQQNISNSATTINKGNWDDNQIIELSDGKIASIYGNSSTSTLHVSLRNSDLSLLKDIDLTSTGFSSSNACWPGMCRFGSGFAVTGWQSGSIRLLTFTNSGGNLSNNAVGMSNAGGTPVTMCGTDVTHFGGGFFGIFSVGNTDGGSTYDQKYGVFRATGGVSGSVIVLQTGLSQTDIYGFWHSAGIHVSKKTNSSRTNSYTINNLRKSVIGVALNSASADGSVRLATKGTYQLTSSYDSGGNFDNRATAVSGTKGNVVGSTANLFGMS